MLLAYLDESGNTGSRLDDRDQPVHWIGCVLVPEDAALPLAEALDAVVARHVPDDPARELHGTELLRGKRRWEGTPVETRIAVYEESVAQLREHDCAVAHACVDKVRLARRGDTRAPHFIALQFLVEKLDSYLRTQPDPLRQRALLVADETNEHEAFAISMVAAMQRGDGGVFHGPQVRRIVDTAHFVKSETNRGVQLADLVTFAIARRARDRQSDKRGDVLFRAMVEQHIDPQRRTWREIWPR